MDRSTSTVLTILNITDPVGPVIDPNAKINNFIDQPSRLHNQADSNGVRFGQRDRLPNPSGRHQSKRINVSAAFYLSIEFQETGFCGTYAKSHGDAVGTSTSGGSHQLPVYINIDNF